jgi:hypothetical protein
LAQVLGVRTDSGCHRGILGTLELDLPATTDNPAGDEVVVVWVEWAEPAEEETFVLETLLELCVFEDFCAVSGSTSGDDKHAAVDVARGRNFKVVALEVEAADEVPEALEGDTSWLTNNTLVGSDNTDVRIFERCKERREESIRWPESCRVNRDNDIGFHMRHGMADLSALVTLALLYDVDFVFVGSIQCIDDCLTYGKIFLTNGRNNDFSRVVRKDSEQAIDELRIVWLGVDNRKDDCNIATSDHWVLWDRDWLVQPEGYHVYDQAEISPDEEGDEDFSVIGSHGVVHGDEKGREKGPGGRRERDDVFGGHVVHCEREIL